MKIIGIIPARGGSKSVPRKNIKILGDKPLICYTIESALQSNLLNTCMVSTEDREIAEISKDAKMPVPFMRPDALAQDATPTIEVVKHVIETYEDRMEFFDAVMILQPTCPFRSQHEIDECIGIFIKQAADSLISVREVPSHFNPHWVFEENERGNLKIATGESKIISRRQELPKAYYRDGSVYITKIEVLKKQNSLYGETIAYRLNDSTMHVNIDNMQDWESAEKIIKG